MANNNKNFEHIFYPSISYGIVIKSGTDSTLKDIKGQEYLDFNAGLWSAILGHSHPALTEALCEQSKRVIHLGYGFWSEVVFEATKQITSITPEKLNKVIFTCTGSESTECALKIARLFTNKYEIIGIERGYYGATQDAQSASGFGAHYGMNFPRSVGSHKLLAPYCYRCPVAQNYPECNFLCLEVSKKLIDSNTSGKIAAIIFEPIFAAGGMIIPPDGYFKALKVITEQYDALLIDDEVTTGIGRTGKWFGIEHYKLIPDILFMSKTLGCGFPVGAVVTTSEIEEVCKEKKMVHIQSHTFDPLPASIAKKVIDVVIKENLIKRSDVEGKYLLKRLLELKEKFNFIGDVRGKGLMLGIEIVNPINKSPKPKLGLEIERKLLKNGIIMSFSSYSSVFRLLPPLIIKREEIDRALGILEEVLKNVI